MGDRLGQERIENSTQQESRRKDQLDAKDEKLRVIAERKRKGEVALLTRRRHGNATHLFDLKGCLMLMSGVVLNI